MNELVQQHFSKPYGVGRITESDCIKVSLQSTEMGRSVVLTLKIENEMISQFRYLVRGCPYTIATFSYCATVCEGQPVDILQSITRQQLAHLLEYPSTKLHAGAFAEDALKQLYAMARL